jgi:superfamily I DNA/RNA helicase
VPLKEIAVLYRTHSQSRPLEEAFIKAGVPHVIVGDTAFYTRKEIKDAVEPERFRVPGESDKHAAAENRSGDVNETSRLGAVVAVG